MEFDYNYMYGMDEEMGAAFMIFYLICALFSFGFSIASYVLRSLGLYTIAKRRGISKPWLAWIPVADYWIVGSISDQYRYVTKGQIKNKRKILIGLWLGMIAVVIAMIVGMAAAAVSMGDAAIVLVLLVSALLMIVASLAFYVFYYMAMYDVYTSVNPPYNVVFLVLSIIFNVTEPFFIFFNRKKDGGMPPRCDIPVAPVNPSEPQPQPIPAPVPAPEPAPVPQPEPAPEPEPEPVTEPVTEPGEDLPEFPIDDIWDSESES